VTSIVAESAMPTSPRVVSRDHAGRRWVRFLAALEREILVLDAGMGTRLCARGLDLGRDDPCLWNLDRPDDVLDVHRRDAAAGCHAVFTNTFGANRAWLERFGRRDDVEAINRAGVDLARRSVGPSGFVVGDIGPSSVDQPGAASEQAAVLADAGVDALVFETFEFESASAALEELRTMPGAAPVPVIVSLWRWPDAVEDAARRLVDAGADVIGINCRPAMSDALALVQRLAGTVACPLMVKPGVAAGDPEWASTPSAFADAVPALIEHNVRLIGGCCGTTEAHVAAVAAACAIHSNPETRQRRGAAP
jgi:methionine synthase I (cobalamin-dependent)